MKNTKISWATHTMNFWVGCEEVSPACDLCYARGWAARAGKADAWQGMRYKTKTWGEPMKFHAAALVSGDRPSIFANSLSDFFDNHKDVGPWRRDAWPIIAACHACDWYLVTKRIPNVEKMLPPDWSPQWYRHVVIIITAVTQAEADREIPRLLALKAKFPWLRVGLSMEPLLEAVDLSRWTTDPARFADYCDTVGGPAPTLSPRLDWVIVGGESGSKEKARPMNPVWAMAIRDQCKAAGVPFHFKQFGAWQPTTVFNTSRELGFWEGDKFVRARWHTVYSRKESNVIMQSVLPSDQHANNVLGGLVYAASPRAVAA